MAAAKKSLTKKFEEGLLFVYLTLFPLGQLIRTGVELFTVKIRLHPADILVGLSAIPLLLGKYKKPKVFNYILPFFAVAGFSLVFSLLVFNTKEVVVGGMYFVRLLFYFLFFLLTWNSVAKNRKLKPTLFNSLIAVSLAVAILGWIQYFWVPDLTALKYLGWDDHLDRLVGTFLDPGYTSIILVLGVLITLVKFLKERDNKLIFLLALFVVTIAFTYARAAYLALIAGSFVVVYLKKEIKSVFWLLLLLFVVLPFLPRPTGGEGVKLERVHSFYAKTENYTQTLTIAREYPLFGVGFNNMCAARNIFFNDKAHQFESHACAGADSSLLFVLATTGMVGFLTFLNLLYGLVKSVKTDVYGASFLSCLAALGVHSLFVNSLFYPWVMGWMGILLALAHKNRRYNQRR